MGFISFLFPWGVILQAIALVHFIRRRPDTVWIYIIVFLGGLGALVYIFMEVLPDLGLLRQSFDSFGRRKRIKQLEAVVVENPAAGNYEELADLLLDEKKFARARECYDKAITSRGDPDPIYRRGIAEIQLGDFAAAVADLEDVTSRDDRYDFNRAIALLAHAYANTAQPEKAEALFKLATDRSTLVGDLSELRRLPGVAEPERRSARLGAAGPGAEVDDSPLPAAPRAPLVPQGRRDPQARPGGVDVSSA